ncbi:UNVERIFIED_CONTAM: hypothetical protein Slati_2527300 [Sesamum latifolium]|uniref:Uncharacterized protein n=1 Tax=Sesamum latifolium TaxID=2727402 RepID=A0AAW2WFA7_9LAMI
MMVQTTSLEEQISSLTAAVENLLKYVQACDDQLNKLHDKFQSTPTLNEFEEQDFSIDGFVSIEHVKNAVNEAIANTYKTRVQVFKSYVKPYTKRIEQLRMLENYLQSVNNLMIMGILGNILLTSLKHATLLELMEIF